VSTTPSTTRATRARFAILAMVTIGTMINYLDRTVLGIAAPSMTKEMGFDPAIMGVVFSAFAWTYAAAQIPGGVFLDRFGTRLTYALSVGFWSFFTLLQGFTHNFASLLGYRLALGVAEAPCYPANSRILSTWFPAQERATANGVYSVGQYFGLGFLSPVLFWIVATYGWRSLFIICGVLGILFALVWWARYREPHQSKANQAELDHIEAGGGLGLGAGVERVPFTFPNIGKLLSKRQVLGASIGQFCGNATLVFFITWFPTYLATERNMGFIKVGFFAILPFLAASVGVLFGGFMSDLLLKRTGSPSIARKTPIIAGLLLATCIIAANFLDNDAAVIAVLSVAFFGQGMVNLGWTLVSDVAPKRLIGLTGGVFNLCTNLAGIITPLVIGLIVAKTGSFVYALAFISALAMIGVLAYVFIVGEVKRVEIEGV